MLVLWFLLFRFYGCVNIDLILCVLLRLLHPKKNVYRKPGAKQWLISKSPTHRFEAQQLRDRMVGAPTIKRSLSSMLSSSSSSGHFVAAWCGYTLAYEHVHQKSK